MLRVPHVLSQLSGRSLLLVLFALPMAGGCSSIRVTDPYRTASEQFLMTIAAGQAVSQLSVDGLRDYLVYVDSTYLMATPEPQPQDLFLVGELRARLLREGVRITPERDKADVVLEVRSGALGIDRYEYLLGLPSIALPSNPSGPGSLPVQTPELAILKSTKQRGYGSVAISAYRVKDGAMLAQSGPFVGRTLREDFWIFGVGPKTVGNIPPAEK